MDPSRKRRIRLVVAATAALLLASALIYTSFSAGSDEKTAGQLLTSARAGETYTLAGTVAPKSVRRGDGVLWFRILDPHRRVSALVRYTGLVPDPFREGRGVMVKVQLGRGGLERQHVDRVRRREGLDGHEVPVEVPGRSRETAEQALPRSC